MRFRLRPGCLAAALLLVGGCGDKMCKVTGEVTFDGKPVESGEVQFTPEDPHHRTEVGQIKDGKFELRSTPGKMKVEVKASRAIPGTKDPLNPGPIIDSYIPARYNTNTELTAEVTSGGPNHFTYHLESKKK
jgi:hypothetical protein